MFILYFIPHRPVIFSYLVTVPMLYSMLGDDFAVASGADANDMGKLLQEFLDPPVSSYKIIDTVRLLPLGVDSRDEESGSYLSEEKTTVVFNEVITRQKVSTKNGIFHFRRNESVCKDLST